MTPVGFPRSPVDSMPHAVENAERVLCILGTAVDCASGQWMDFVVPTSHLCTWSTIHIPYYYSCQNLN